MFSETLPCREPREAHVRHAMTGTPPTAPLTHESVLAHLRTVARDELKLKPEQIARIQPETPIADGLHLDSLTQVILVTGLEEHYGFEVDLDDRERLAEVETIGDLVHFIRQCAARHHSTS